MEKFKEVLEKKLKKIKLVDLPKTIPGGEYDDEMTFYNYDKKYGSYEYTQIEPEEFGDYGDEGEKYNQGYTLECRIDLKDGELHLTTEVTDLGRKSNHAFGKKYSNLTFTTIESLVSELKKIVVEFDKL